MADKDINEMDSGALGRVKRFQDVLDKKPRKRKSDNDGNGDRQGYSKVSKAAGSTNEEEEEIQEDHAAAIVWGAGEKRPEDVKQSFADALKDRFREMTLGYREELPLQAAEPEKTEVETTEQPEETETNG